MLEKNEYIDIRKQLKKFTCQKCKGPLDVCAFIGHVMVTCKEFPFEGAHGNDDVIIEKMKDKTWLVSSAWNRHLLEASIEVSKWPAWKQDMLGKVSDKTEKYRNMKIKKGSPKYFKKHKMQEDKSDDCDY